ncbi:MAG: ATP-binding cassette domain-containing protein [Zoogloeaceae bacterium]|nr:ATP-binding cassette domain-containing protein [Zoogloeaceae bacterium]
MIEFEEVSKRYPGGHLALAGVSFSIRHGELLLLSGHSGAGKSTLLKLIAAIERPTQGRVLINGQDVGKLRADAIPYLRRKLGLILQDHPLLQDRSVFENLMLPLEIAGEPTREARKRAHAALERVGLKDRGQERPITLSGGEQQRVAIARAIINRPSLLIADEPTAYLDSACAEDIAQLFQSFNDAGVTVIVSTHNLGLFATDRLRTLRLAQGALVYEEAP